MLKRIVACIPLFLVVVFAVVIVNDHLLMSARVAPVAERFNKLVDEHYTAGTPFSGRIDRLIAERNEVLRKAHYLWLGSWSADDHGQLALYLNAGWMPEKMYQYVWTAAAHGSQSLASSLILCFSIPATFFVFAGAIAASVVLVRLAYRGR